MRVQKTPRERKTTILSEIPRASMYSLASNRKTTKKLAEQENLANELNAKTGSWVFLSIHLSFRNM
jgi:hypothetical protein